MARAVVSGTESDGISKLDPEIGISLYEYLNGNIVIIFDGDGTRNQKSHP
jgi:hypothetical protein